MRRLCVVSLCCLGLACGAADSEGDSGDTEGSTAAAADASGDSSGQGSSSGGTTAPTDGSTTERPQSTTGSGETGDTSLATSTTTVADSGESGSEESTGPALPRGQWAITEITYTEGGMSETLTMQDRAFCDATLDGGVLLLRYQQQGGFTVWALYVPEGVGVGSHALTQDFSGVYMNINEVSNAWQAYFDPAMAFGTLELTAADLTPGGVVEGTLTATLTSNDGTTTADFESTFYAEIPQ